MLICPSALFCTVRSEPKFHLYDVVSYSMEAKATFQIILRRGCDENHVLRFALPRMAINILYKTTLIELDANCLRVVMLRMYRKTRCQFGNCSSPVFNIIKEINNLAGFA